jgi:integrase/recombinase XerD
MQNAIAEFREYLTSERQVSGSTLNSYVHDVTQFDKFLLGLGQKDPAQAGRDIMLEYMEWLDAQGRSASTRMRAAASLKCYYSFLQAKGRTQENPAHHLIPPRAGKRLPEVLTGREIELLLAQPDASRAKGCRDRAMLELLYATGIRVSEMTALDLHDVNLSAGFVRCGQGHSERKVPLYPAAVRALMDYINIARGHLVSTIAEPALFVNMNGERMSRQGFWKIIKQYQESARITKQITPHTLRHSFAAHLIENGADLRSLQEMMGHADISSTQVYANLVRRQIHDVYRRAHPKA